MSQKALVWFRQDLRIKDNPALSVAINKGFQIIPIFILDEYSSNNYPMGKASKLWLYHSLNQLNQSLENTLIFCNGNSLDIIIDLIKTLDIVYVCWNRCYESWQIERDKEIKKTLNKLNIYSETHNGSLIWEPWDILKPDYQPYKIFTAFYHKCLQIKPSREIVNYNKELNVYNIKNKEYYTQKPYITNTNMLITNLSWENDIIKHWNFGEDAAKKQLDYFLKTNIANYRIGRDFPSCNTVSRLSPHLHFGEISPNQIWKKLLEIKNDNNLEHFRRELIWREFSYNLMFYNPNLHNKNWQNKFDQFPWKNDPDKMQSWKKGMTGIPIIDAGMRELWKTGYMHNRVRMIVASFLTKNLMIDWRDGAAWFWDTLFDADLANNSANWQWVAGCGADAAPYFRIFNPILQSQKFDPEGKYIRYYIPELNLLPSKYIHNPSLAPANILSTAKIRLGDNYPAPIVNLTHSRQEALRAFKSISS
jgi:deoxyribodipyrimidine photo-lyase